jgi:hypothetical protein
MIKGTDPELAFYVVVLRGLSLTVNKYNFAAGFARVLKFFTEHFCVCLGLLLAAPLDFPHRGKSRLEFMLARPQLKLRAPWPLA